VLLIRGLHYSLDVQAGQVKGDNFGKKGLEALRGMNIFSSSVQRIFEPSQGAL
jgi:hypothetical protein